MTINNIKRKLKTLFSCIREIELKKQNKDSMQKVYNSHCYDAIRKALNNELIKNIKILTKYAIDWLEVNR